MNIIVNEELKAYIDPLTPDEFAALERSILTEGCRDALVLWGDVQILVWKWAAFYPISFLAPESMIGVFACL